MFYDLSQRAVTHHCLTLESRQWVISAPLSWQLRFLGGVCRLQAHYFCFHVGSICLQVISQFCPPVWVEIEECLMKSRPDDTCLAKIREMALFVKNMDTSICQLRFGSHSVLANTRRHFRWASEGQGSVALTPWL